jgi:hypothetical protein
MSIGQVSNQLWIYKGRTMVVPMSLGFDVSNDTFESHIRTEKRRESELIAEWVITFETDGTDGELVLTLDNSVTDLLDESRGYMDVKRITGGEPINVFDEPLEVLIKDPVTT